MLAVRSGWVWKWRKSLFEQIRKLFTELSQEILMGFTVFYLFFRFVQLQLHSNAIWSASCVANPDSFLWHDMEENWSEFSCSSQPSLKHTPFCSFSLDVNIAVWFWLKTVDVSERRKFIVKRFLWDFSLLCRIFGSIQPVNQHLRENLKKSKFCCLPQVLK